MRPVTRTLFLAIGFSSLCAAARAQTSFVFDLDQPSSNFTWSGTSTVGPIVGNPSNTFQLAGTTNLDLVTAAGAQPFTQGQFTGGDARAVPDLHGKINNILPFLPPLVTIDVLSLHLTPTSAAFVVDSLGQFTATVTITALSGTLVVTPLGQAASNTNLTGLASTPTPVSGTLSINGSAIHLNAPINTTFPFSDPASGASGTITLAGTINADFQLFLKYCFGDGSGSACPCGNNSPVGGGAGCLSSIGQGGHLAASGFPSVSADTLSLDGTTMPATAASLFFQGTLTENGGAGSLLGDGLLCTGGMLTRLGIRANSAGASSFPGPSGTPLISVRGSVPTTGATRFYQAWFRNAVAFCTSETFNLTNGLQVTWLP